MKSLFIFLISITTVTVFSSFSADGNKEAQPVSCGSKTFAKRLSEVRFSASGRLIKATSLADKSTSVLYSAEGELVETNKAIGAEELPSTIKDELAKTYPTYKVSKVVRFERVAEAGFYIHAENDKNAITLEAEENGSLREKQ
jgi:hypothetical protein